MNTLNSLPYSKQLEACEAAVGRNLLTADSLEQTNFGDCVRNDFWWKEDGACRYFLHDTLEEAVAEATRLGFAPVSTGEGFSADYRAAI